MTNKLPSICLKTRSQLRAEWTDFEGSALTFLPFAKQYEINMYYRPTKNFTDVQALEYRDEVIRTNPLLEDQAAKALSFISPHLNVRRAPVASRKSEPVWHKENRDVRVFSQMNPELNPKELARIVVATALEQVRLNKH